MKYWRITYEHEVKPMSKPFSGRIKTGLLTVAAPEMAEAYRKAQKELGGIKRLRIVSCEEIDGNGCPRSEERQ